MENHNLSQHWQLVDYFVGNGDDMVKPRHRPHVHGMTGIRRYTVSKPYRRHCKFPLLMTQHNNLQNYLHFTGKDWIASFYFRSEMQPDGTIGEKEVSRLRIRGNRARAEEELMTAYLGIT